MSFFDLFPPPKFLSLATTDAFNTDKGIKFKSGTSATFANGILPDEKAYLFTKSFDNVPKDGLYDAVAFIVEENVPISLKEAVFSYEIIEEDPPAGGGRIKVAVTVVPKSVISEEIKRFESAGITVTSFYTESQAIAREVIPQGDMRVHLIVNLAEKKTGFYIVEKRVVQFSTTINHENGIELREISEIKAKMEEVVGFWASNVGPKAKIERIFLCGARSSKADLVEALKANAMGMQFANTECWLN